MGKWWDKDEFDEEERRYRKRYEEEEDDEPISSKGKKEFFIYINHCWNCKAQVSSIGDVRCSCGFYICSKCGACRC